MLKQLQQLRDLVMEALEHNSTAAADLAHRIAPSLLPPDPGRNGKHRADGDALPLYTWNGRRWERQQLEI
jgi:hypothetical protein